MRWVLLLAALGAGCGSIDDVDAGDDDDADADADGDGDADGDSDAPACGLPDDAGPLTLSLRVDSAPVRTCVAGRWKLNVRVCGEAAAAECADAACPGDCDAGGGCLLGDACTDEEFTIPTAGHYRMCVEAELVNGFFNAQKCTDIDVGAAGVPAPIPVDLDTEGTFPCVRDWTYDPDEDMCCDYNVGYCAPPEF
jgi:hypothetical protein